MASSEVTIALQKLESPDFSSTDRPNAYSDLLARITSQRSTSPTFPSDLTAFITSILSDTLGIVAARPLLLSAIQVIKDVPSPEQRISLGTSALSALSARVVSFEDADASLRYTLASAYEAEEEWVESARVLQGINLESSQRKISDENKVDDWIRICRLYLEADDPTTAESYLNRSKNLLYKLPPNAQARLLFQLSQARILDSQRRFLDAASTYHAISFAHNVDEEEKLRALSMAMTCGVLAPAGPLRSRTLAKLYKDERAPQCPEYGILEKMFLDRLLQPDEVEKFAANLAPHQVARTADGTTVLAKAVVEHNLLSASRVYANIRFKDLGGLLGTDEEKAEDVASRMVQQGRVVGRIDQIEGVIVFGERVGSGEAKLEGLRKWDGRVQGLAEEVERVASLVRARETVH